MTKSSMIAPGNPTTYRGASHSYNADNQDTANTYDGNGNPMTYNGKSLFFDPESRLAYYSTLTTCGYNGDGLRGWQGNGQGNNRTYFLYDGDDPVCEVDGSGNLSAVNDFGADGVWARHTTTEQWLYTWDTQGGLSQQIRPDGSVRVSALFDAQGGESLSAALPADPYAGFGGQWGYRTDWQANYPSSLVLCGHRFYDFNSGRFLNRDPMGYDGGVNLYGYTANNPVNNCDPDGYADIHCDGKIFRSRVGDPDRQKGNPHYDGPNGCWIDYFGYIHCPDKPCKPVSQSCLDQIQKQLGKWPQPPNAPQKPCGPQRTTNPLPYTDPALQEDKPCQDITGETFLPIFLGGGIGRALGPVLGRGIPIPIGRPVPIPVH